MSYKQLTQEQRYVIYVLNKRDCTQKEIAEEVDVDPSTISRELTRNEGQRGYRYKQAHRKALQRRKGKAKTRITDEDWEQVEEKIKEQWSPEQIAGRFGKEGKLEISHEWIYKHIWKDKKNGGDLYENLRIGRRYRKGYGTKSKQGKLQNRTSIEERPETVEERDRIGDWEADTIIGKNHNGAMLTVVDRNARFTLMGHLPKKTAAATRQQQVRLLKDHKKNVHTITNDNGREFADHDQTAEELETDIFFCNPYASWERGTVENMNGLVRQYFPKDQLLKEVDEEESVESRSCLITDPGSVSIGKPHTKSFTTPN